MTTDPVKAALVECVEALRHLKMHRPKVDNCGVCGCSNITVIRKAIAAAERVMVDRTDTAYEYLPGDGPTTVKYAYGILDRMTTDMVNGKGNYEAACKVRVIFRKYFEATGILKKSNDVDS